MALRDLYVADTWAVIAYEMKVKAVIVVGMFSVIPQLVTLMQGRLYLKWAMGEAILEALEQGDNRVDTIDSGGKVVVYVVCR